MCRGKGRRQHPPRHKQITRLRSSARAHTRHRRLLPSATSCPRQPLVAEPRRRPRKDSVFHRTPGAPAHRDRAMCSELRISSLTSHGAWSSQEAIGLHILPNPPSCLHRSSLKFLFTFMTATYTTKRENTHATMSASRNKRCGQCHLPRPVSWLATCSSTSGMVSCGGSESSHLAPAQARSGAHIEPRMALHTRRRRAHACRSASTHVRTHMLIKCPLSKTPRSGPLWGCVAKSVATLDVFAWANTSQVAGEFDQIHGWPEQHLVRLARATPRLL